VTPWRPATGFCASFTHEGGRARRFTPEQELRRSLMNCLLWEDQFYEDGVAIAERAMAHPGTGDRAGEGRRACRGGARGD